MENLWMYLGVVAVAVAIFAMIDIAIKEYSFRTRLLWLPIVILFPLVGPIVYYSMRKSLS
ncbi:MAG: PLD nuclease N-terminal domain-containing protein [Ekhidna sp.]